MALITCPKCGKEVSDKAKKCLSCGMVLIADDPVKTIICEDCGTEIPEENDICPNCGCPVNNEIDQEKPSDNIQKVEVASVKVSLDKKKITKLALIVGIALVVIIALIIGISSASKKKAVSSYSETLSTATAVIITGASEAEDAGNLIKSVWYNTIYEESDPSTDKYTKNTYGYGFNSDFNTSLQNLFSDSSFSESILSIKNNQTTASDLMKDLQNPPEEYSEAYATIKELYDAYLNLTNMVTNPTGSLTTFSSDFNSADSEVANQYNKMELYLDN